LKRKKVLAHNRKYLRICSAVRQQFPTGDVVVSENDLAQQLRKRTDVVVKALDVLLNENKVQRARWPDIGS
jgi:DNA-binding GntR family transcriptional regulator